MPVIVVGADTKAGQDILEGLFRPDREVRAFVSQIDVAKGLKERGFKVAIGDVSDEGHVEAAATRCFSAILIAEAATDSRERSFATTTAEVLAGWARAVTNSKVTRVIWVSPEEPPPTGVKEVATIDPAKHDLVERVVALDDAQLI